jgi:hypothetical protein
VLVACGTAALFCPSAGEALGPSRDAARTFQQERTTTIAPLSCTWQIDGMAFGSNASATAALARMELPRLPFSLHSVTANDSPSSREKMRRHDGRGPPALGAINARGNDDQRHPDDQGCDASRASLTAGPHRAAPGSITCRLLHRSARPHSLRGPPQ